MIDTAAPSNSAPKKRGQGRPVSGENDVGRERLLAATEKLLRTMPPARVTIARIAQEAGVDPALVRYYFGNRAALLVAVVDEFIIVLRGGVPTFVREVAERHARGDFSSEV